MTATVDADSGMRVVSGTTERLYAGSTPSNQELYGGSGRLSACDPQAIAAFLAAHPDKAAAWAGVRDMEPDVIPGYLDALTPVVLLHDTVVTNHGFAGGAATSFVSVLQAGTAVLVDATGLPVVRCACGNPLSVAPRVNLSTAQVDGNRWGGYDPDGALAVLPGSAVGEFVLVDVATGQDVTVTAGPATVSPTSAPPTSAKAAGGTATPTAPSAAPTSAETSAAPTSPAATTDGACVLDLAWPEVTPGWAESPEGNLTCQEMIDRWRRYEQWPGERGGSQQWVTFDDGWTCTTTLASDTTSAVGHCAQADDRRFVVNAGRPGQQSAGTAVTSGAQSDSAADLLITPSGNIECAVRNGQFGCTLKEFDFDLGDERCPGTRGPLVELDATGPSRESSCRGDFFADITWPDPTPYGTSVLLGVIACDVEETGLTCTNPQGHGFSMSRSTVQPF